MIVSDRRHAPHVWSNSYVCVTVGHRLDMSKFTEGDWQRVLKAKSSSNWKALFMNRKIV